MNTSMLKILLGSFDLPPQVRAFIDDLIKADLKKCRYELVTPNDVVAADGSKVLCVEGERDGKKITAFLILE